MFLLKILNLTLILNNMTLLYKAFLELTNLCKMYWFCRDAQFSFKGCFAKVCGIEVWPTQSSIRRSLWTYCHLVSCSRGYTANILSFNSMCESRFAISSSPSVGLVSQHWWEICWICFSSHFAKGSGHLLWLFAPPADGWVMQHVRTNLHAFCKVTWS